LNPVANHNSRNQTSPATHGNKGEAIIVTTYDSGSEPRLVLPFLKPFYNLVVPLSWLVVRCSVGIILAVHGWGKIDRVIAFGQSLEPRGFYPGVPLGFLILFVELVGGICIAAGLFTRFFAAAAAIELGIITFTQYIGHGFSWTSRGYEYVLMWGLVLFAVALRGGGPWSIDRKIGREL
jgi:putative oxidoreductase